MNKPIALAAFALALFASTSTFAQGVNIKPAWTVPQWYVDPANASGNASDNNVCTISTAPCKTFGQVAARWGTYKPRLRQITTFTLLSSCSDDTDPWYFEPYLENNAYVIINASSNGTQLATGTVTTITALSRLAAAGNLWQGTGWPTPGVGLVDSATGYPYSSPVGGPQLVLDSTQSAKFWMYRLVSGTTYSITTPVVFQSAPLAIGTWYAGATPASGDTVTIYNPFAANIRTILPTVEGTTGGASTSGVWVQGIRIFAPAAYVTGGNGNEVVIGNNVHLLDVASDRAIVKAATGGNAVDLMEDVFAPALMSGAVGATNSEYHLNVTQLFGGAFFEGNVWAGGELIVDGDVIMRDSQFLAGPSSQIDLDCLYLDTGAIVEVGGNSFAKTSASGYATAGQSAMWAPNASPWTLDVSPGGRLSIPSNTAANHLRNATLSICGKTTACNGDNANLSANCGISLTAANIDAAFGAAGFGGNASVPGCGSIGKFGTNN